MRLDTRPQLTVFPETHRLAGKRAWLFPASGRLVPVVSGGDGPTDPPAPQPAPQTQPTPAPSTPPPAGLQWTPEQQAELARIAAREKDEGRRAAEQTVAQQLGCTVDEAKAILERHRNAERDAMSEAERAKADAETARAAAQQAEAQAKKALRDANVTLALTNAGVRADRRDAAIRLTTIADDADDAAIAAAVEATKTAYPEFFTAPAQPTPSSVPGGPAPTPTPTPGGLAAGAELAKQYAAEHGLTLVPPVAS